ncbi:MAG: serine/threonine protein kinase, partial [Gemmatimonadetes bacterium]|nr:serine/threonine protein kinase [Gemmatimonadota bacterium]
MNDEHRSIADLQVALGDDFRIEHQLGSGSKSTVYQAWENSLGRAVAIKVLRPSLVGDEEALRRFEREAKAVAALDHPHVARVYRLGRLADQTPYVVMRLVKGRTMQERLKTEGMLPPELAIPVLKDVVSALLAAHTIGIVHRDVRPENILWDDDNDRALLVDFGISALFPAHGGLTALRDTTEPLIGAAAYLSPEQIRDDFVSLQADIYCFGVLAYELLTGQGPYEARTEAEMIEAHLHGEPRHLGKARRDIEPNIANVLRQCLDKDPKKRPSASDVSRALEGIWQLPSHDAGGRHLLTLIEEKRMTQVIAGGFVASGFVVGGVATLSEQY